jgi:hypothetical protein
LIESKFTKVNVAVISLFFHRFLSPKVILFEHQILNMNISLNKDENSSHCVSLTSTRKSNSS